MKIFLYSTLGVDDGLPLLNQWIAHYRRLGILSINMRIVLHTQHRHHQKLDHARLRLRAEGIEPRRLWHGPFSSDENYHYRKWIWQDCQLGQDDWFVIADSDECHQFDRSLEDTLAECNQAGINAIEGRLIDRIDRNGAMPTVDPQQSLDEQFPLYSRLTATELDMNDLKIVAHKRTTFAGRMHRANHGIAPEYGSPTIRRDACDIHHFKWTSGVLDRMKCRAAYYASIGRDTDATKNAQFVRQVAENGNKLPLTSCYTSLRKKLAFAS